MKPWGRIWVGGSRFKGDVWAFVRKDWEDKPELKFDAAVQHRHAAAHVIVVVSGVRDHSDHSLSQFHSDHSLVQLVSF